ncbi:MAG: hypothetical protein QOI74_3088, partial [Micromonosporaceae bacterium]|nr:hypothetical protein [Micromonosporaceae bacterium]
MTNPRTMPARRRLGWWPATTRYPCDAGSIPLALLITLVGLSLSALLVPIVLTQVRSTRVEVRRVESLRAAQTGVDVALAHVRNAYTGIDADGNFIGDPLKLPCDPLTGNVGAEGAAHYRVTVDYFDFVPNPTDYLNGLGGYADAWIDSRKLVCRASIPAFALIRSQGAADQEITTSACSSDMRCLRATYTFVTTNQNVAGGLIHVYKTAVSNDLCLSAGSTTLTAAALTGTALTVQTCDAAKPAQIFSYNKDLSITLVGSKSSITVDGLCLDGRAASGLAVQFQPCLLASQPTQRWIFTSSAAFVAQNGRCFRVASPNFSGSTVVQDNTLCGGGSYSNVADFSPDAAVGAGAAGKSTNQLVNYKQFGRCLDVTRQNYQYPSAAAPYLISWPCKQTTPVDWNQKWALPSPVPAGPTGVTGLITTTSPNTNPTQGSPAGRYCLQSPASIAPLQFVK